MKIETRYNIAIVVAVAALVAAFAASAAPTANEDYVDRQDAATLQAAKDYADVATNEVLRQAKDYADQHGGGSGGFDTNAVERIANRAVETNAVTVALSSSVSGLQSSKLSKSDVIDPAIATTNGPAADAKATGDALNAKFDAKSPWYFPGYDSGGRLKWETDFYTLFLYDSSFSVGMDFTVAGDAVFNGSLKVGDTDFDDVIVNGGIAELNEIQSSLAHFGDLVVDNEGLRVDVRDGTVTANVDVRIEDVGEVHSLRTKADRSMISATDPTFSNEVAEVAKTVTPTPTGTLRLFDPVLNRWVILKSVNMNLTLEVE